MSKEDDNFDRDMKWGLIIFIACVVMYAGCEIALLYLKYLAAQ